MSMQQEVMRQANELQSKKDCFIKLCLIEKGFRTLEEVKERVTVNEKDHIETWLLDDKPFAQFGPVEVSFIESNERNNIRVIAEYKALKL